MARELAFCLSGLMFIQSGLVVANAKSNQVGNKDTRIERAELRPTLVAKFQAVAELKIASRKTDFYQGEMIAVDVALLNTSRHPVFFRKLSELRINVLNDAGRPLAVQEYGIADRALVPARFIRLSPGEISVQSFQLLAGCDKRAFAQFASTQSDDRSVFKNSLFLNWGDACLPTTQPGPYTVSVEIENEFVLVQSRTERISTAVGKIQSNSLKMTIKNDN